MIARVSVTLAEWTHASTGVVMLGFANGYYGSASVVEGTLQIVSMSSANYFYSVADDDGTARISVLSADFQAIKKVVNETNGAEVTMMSSGDGNWHSYGNTLFGGLSAGDTCILQIYAI